MAACLAVTFGTATALPAGARTAGPQCDSSQPRGTAEDYDGGSVSALYDSLFHPAEEALPYLDSYIPQSLLAWDDWDRSGQDLMLVGMYRNGSPSLVVGLDAESGAPVGTVEVEPSHLGGMAFLGPWLFTGDN
ncbi:MAG: hypothetical protein JO144_00315, partial [Actinobacteria bacterium]|nr:hypothetical protein [Actinomycetota bacterium]